MKILFIGGTGNISAACVRLALAQGHEVHLLNRGRRLAADYGLEGVHTLTADIHDEAATAAALAGRTFDAVANFIAYQPEDVARDERLFAGRCAQYLFVSSASVYQKPLAQPFVTESTPLKNPYWDYSRAKIACEEACQRAYRERDFPVTIVRPSLTYQTVIPLAIGGWTDFSIIARMRRGGEVVVHGDGTSLWTITHSEDFAAGFNGLLGHPQAVGEAFHITSDELLTWDQITDAVSIAAGAGPARKVHINSELIARCIPWQLGGLLGDKAVCALFDNSKIKRVAPAFKAVIPFHEGIRRTLEWFEEQPERCRVTPDTDRMLDALIAAWRRACEHFQPL